MTMTDEEIYDLVFAPGFSTADKITDVSGRGVGMDVVKKNIEKLNGIVNIASTPGKGSVFTIRLPLTMAIMDSMVVRVGVERYILPILNIRESLRPLQKNVSTVQGKGELINVRGNLIKLIRLNHAFSLKSSYNEPWEAIVIIVESNGKSYGLMVDEIIGQQQIVIKSLKGELKNSKGISGCSILGDGKVGLIVDVKGVVEISLSKENNLIKEEVI